MRNRLINECIATLLLTIGIVCISTIHVIADETEFHRDIEPTLEEHCWDCHGEDEHESGLRLDLRARMLKGSDSWFTALVLGETEKSYLMEAVNHVDEEMATPPYEDKIHNIAGDPEYKSTITQLEQELQIQIKAVDISWQQLPGGLAKTEQKTRTIVGIQHAI